MHSHKILNIFPVNLSLQEKLVKELNISNVLAQILINRGITDPAQADEFLNVRIQQMLDPFLFSGMEQAVKRIIDAGKRKEKVMIFGDYDVDGITSVALLTNTLKKAKVDCNHYMPHRVKEGYGLNREILNIVRTRGVSLLITADCGISNPIEVAQLKENNVDTIITDHHEPSGKELPSALAVINPKVRGSNYSYRDLAGVGVAYKLCQALSGSMLVGELDLVTIGTVADVVPLTGENRIIVKEGLKMLPQSKRPGIKALIEQARIRANKFSPAFISFILAPRLNASGRIGSAEVSLGLLTSTDESKAKEFASILEEDNRTRQRIEGKIMDEALAIIDKEVNFKEHKIIVVAKDKWHHGVLGVVASKLADRFYRPVIVISLDDALCKGSARSIKSFHLFNALNECKEFLNGFGGHAHAAGLTITKESIDDFKGSINRLAHEKLSLEDLLPSLEIDMELALSDLDDQSIGQLERLAPFGTGNTEPLFLTRNLKLKGEIKSLARETLKFYVTDGKATQQVIGFGMGSLRNSFEGANTFDLVYTARIDSWFDEASVILEAKDVFFR
ncbi:MAG: single-stranded-DNA-specific exonuclease RecJ [Candidatus Omnitrophica bacterium]|nr:single-stranded-DNA-specific exonuclease RecJ [Candidatus Omnitrophota bacterium]